MFVAHLFKIVNFVLLAAVLLYIFKKYIIKSLLTGMRDEQVKVSGLHAQLKALEISVIQSDEEMIVDRSVAQVLLEKVQEWSAVKQQERKIIDRENHLLYQQRDKRQSMQQRWLYMHRLRSRVMPQALADAENRLRKEYTDSGRGREYIEKIVTRIDHKGRG